MGAFSVESVVTNLARQWTARAIAEGYAWKVVSFVMGDLGHNPDQPTIALTPDPAITDCPGIVFGPKAVTGHTYPTPSCPVWQCDLLPLESVALISSICLIGQVQISPYVDDPALNTFFVATYGTFPAEVKVDTKAESFLVAIRF